LTNKPPGGLIDRLRKVSMLTAPDNESEIFLMNCEYHLSYPSGKNRQKKKSEEVRFC